MTVSYFEALEARIPMTAADRLMDAAQAALYPHLTKKSAERVWTGWTTQARGPQPMLTRQQSGQPRPLFTFNGIPVAPSELRGKLAGSLGDRLTA